MYVLGCKLSVFPTQEAAKNIINQLVFNDFAFISNAPQKLPGS